jgi:hypothetical protein
MVLSIPPKLSVAMAVGYLKGKSAIQIHYPPRGAERKARLYGKLLVEGVLRKHSGFGRADDPCLCEETGDLDRQEDLFNQ